MPEMLNWMIFLESQGYIPVSLSTSISSEGFAFAPRTSTNTENPYVIDDLDSVEVTITQSHRVNDAYILPIFRR